MKRVGVYYGLPAGGIGTYNREWLNAIHSVSQDVGLEYICLPEFRWAKDVPFEVWPGLFSISSRIPAARRTRFLLGQYINPRRAIDRMVNQGIQLAHFTTVHHLTFPWWRELLDRSRMKFLVTAHDIRRAAPILHKGHEDRQLAAVYQRADAVIVHSEAQAADLVAFAGVDRERIVIVPHGPYSYGAPQKPKSSVRARFGLTTKDVIGLCFGQLRSDKNLEGLVKALAVPGLRSRLIVAGKAGSKHRGASFYSRIALQMGVQDRVHFDERFVPDDEVADLVAASDWIGIPYRRSFSSMSGVLNLACHYERPLLCGPAPALAEAVTTYGIGTVARDESPASLARALAQLEERISSQASFGFDGFLRSNTWEENARISLETYRRLLD